MLWAVGDKLFNTISTEDAFSGISKIGDLLAPHLFFVLIGASFQLSLLPQIGIIGIIYICFRSFGNNIDKPNYFCFSKKI